LIINSFQEEKIKICGKEGGGIFGSNGESLSGIADFGREIGVREDKVIGKFIGKGVGEILLEDRRSLENEFIGVSLNQNRGIRAIKFARKKVKSIIVPREGRNSGGNNRRKFTREKANQGFIDFFRSSRNKDGDRGEKTRGHDSFFI